MTDSHLGEVVSHVEQIPHKFRCPLEKLRAELELNFECQVKLVVKALVCHVNSEVHISISLHTLCDPIVSKEGIDTLLILSEDLNGETTLRGPKR
jgi:hypothetical protein